MSYFSLQGKIYIGERNTDGTAKKLLYVGNVPGFTLALTVDKIEHKESNSGARAIDLTLIRERKGEVSMRVETLDATNLDLALHSANAAQTTGAVAAEELQEGITAGGIYLLARPNVADVVITDSDDPANTLPAEQYTVNAADGSIAFLDITTGGPYTQPFVAAYDYAAATTSALFVADAPERWVRFVGLNTVPGADPVNMIVDLYRVQFDPLKTLEMISDEIQSMEIAGQVLIDTTKEEDGDLGQFGRVILVPRAET